MVSLLPRGGLSPIWIPVITVILVKAGIHVCALHHRSPGAKQGDVTVDLAVRGFHGKAANTQAATSNAFADLHLNPVVIMLTNTSLSSLPGKFTVVVLRCRLIFSRCSRSIRPSSGGA